MSFRDCMQTLIFHVVVIVIQLVQYIYRAINISFFSIQPLFSIWLPFTGHANGLYQMNKSKRKFRIFLRSHNFSHCHRTPISYTIMIRSAVRDSQATHYGIRDGNHLTLLLPYQVVSKAFSCIMRGSTIYEKFIGSKICNLVKSPL